LCRQPLRLAERSKRPTGSVPLEVKESFLLVPCSTNPEARNGPLVTGVPMVLQPLTKTWVPGFDRRINRPIGIGEGRWL
jgi:hypothetical protein